MAENLPPRDSPGVAADDYAEDFSDAMKEEKILEACQVEAQEEQASVNEIGEKGGSSRSFLHRDPCKTSSDFRVRSLKE